MTQRIGPYIPSPLESYCLATGYPDLPTEDPIALCPTLSDGLPFSTANF